MNKSYKYKENNVSFRTFFQTILFEIFISADFEPKILDENWPKNGKIGKNCWLTISQNDFIMQSGYGEQTLCSKKLELMKQNHLLKIGLVIFLKGATFSDFVENRLWNYIPSGIQICIPLFWGKF